MNVKITSVTSQLPQHKKDTEEVIPFINEWLSEQDDRFRRKAVKIYENAGVDRRFSIMSPDEVFTKTSFEEKNEIYKRESVKLAEKALEAALEEQSIAPEELDFIITVSCTGIMIPSIDAYLINNLGLKQDIVRLPVTEMGCVAGISGMIYANNFLKANPGSLAAVVAVESPTATFQLNDFSMANIVSSAIFGDGCACAILSSHSDAEGPEIVDHGMYHFYDSLDMMGFNLVNSGLQMVLDKEVPNKIASHFPKFLYPFLERNSMSVADLNHLIFHPGGKKIVQTVDELFGAHGKNINNTRNVLRDYGNMSSATVLYVLKEFMNQGVQENETGLMLSFGPGFTAQRLLLRW